MNRRPTRWSGGGAAARVVIMILGVTLAIAPDALAWGPRGFGGGGFGGEEYGRSAPPSYGGGEGYYGGGSGGGGGQMYIYPSKGQSPQQEQADKGQCYTWAVQQSGFDPANPQVPTGPPPTASAPQGGVFRGAAGGAALGAVGGAIGGDAGKGAAIGAATGALFGGMRRRRWAQQEQSQQYSYMEQQQEAMNRGRHNYNRAFGVCMTGRGYTVGG
jgi:YMGG-like Gly-zipper